MFVICSALGLDFKDMAELASELSQHDDVARRCKILRCLITAYQDSITSLEKVCIWILLLLYMFINIYLFTKYYFPLYCVSLKFVLVYYIFLFLLI